MVSVTTILRSGPRGPGPQLHWQPKGEDWRARPGMLGLWRGAGWERGCGVGFRNVCTAEKGLRGFFPCTAHFHPCPGPELRLGGMYPGVDPPRAQGKVAVLGISPGLLSVPSAHQWEPGVWGVG